MDEKIEECGFSEELVKALQDLGYEMLTEVQKRVIPLVLVGKDIIVQSETGSGKTAAFAIPICEKIAVEERNPQVLVLTPTRELAVQLKQDIANIGRLKKIRCAAIFGRQPMDMQVRELKQRVHVIVGTPGRTFDHIARKNINLEKIRYLVIDEADKMLDMGFIEQVKVIIKMVPAHRVTLLFSATMPDKIAEICQQYMSNPIKIEVDATIPTAEKIQQFYYEVEEADKISLMNKIIYTERPTSCILFCNTRDKVDELFKTIKGKGYSCGSLHGGMEQRDRLNIIQRFKRGEFQFMIATDVVARGIHIEDISLVINYDLPLDNENYVHRIGRTGRMDHVGRAITFVTESEYTSWQAIEAYVGYTIPKQPIPTMLEVETGKLIFEDTMQSKTVLKINKSEELNKDITRFRINAGKKTKMRPGDILGAITTIAGLSAEDIGIIDVQDTCSYVEIFRGKGDVVMDALKETKIKGKIQTIKKVDFRSN